VGVKVPSDAVQRRSVLWLGRGRKIPENGGVSRDRKAEEFLLAYWTSSLLCIYVLITRVVFTEAIYP